MRPECDFGFALEYSAAACFWGRRQVVAHLAEMGEPLCSIGAPSLTSSTEPTPDRLVKESLPQRPLFCAGARCVRHAGEQRGQGDRVHVQTLALRGAGQLEPRLVEPFAEQHSTARFGALNRDRSHGETVKNHGAGQRVAAFCTHVLLPDSQAVRSSHSVRHQPAIRDPSR